MKNKKQIFDKYGNYDFPTDLKQDGFNVATSQIGEMAQDIASNCPDLVENCCGSKACYVCIAEGLAKDNYRKLPENAVVLTREEWENFKIQLRIKTNEADWRADQLQALDKDFELLEKVVKCKDCKWL